MVRGGIRVVRRHHRVRIVESVDIRPPVQPTVVMRVRPRRLHRPVPAVVLRVAVVSMRYRVERVRIVRYDFSERVRRSIRV